MEKTMDWIDVLEKWPEPMTEVLVWIDGHRGPLWRNNHALVAYMAPSGEWFEERHSSSGQLIGVMRWAMFEPPDA
jgi:hypothetical protein